MIHEVPSVHDSIGEPPLSDTTGLMITSLEYTPSEILVVLVFLVA